MQAAARAAQAGRSGGSTAERVEDFAPEPDDPYPPDPRDTYEPGGHGAAQPTPAPQTPAHDNGPAAPASTGRWSEALGEDTGGAVSPVAPAPAGEIPVVEDEGRDSLPAEEPRTYGQDALKRAIAEGRVIHSRPAQNAAAPGTDDTGQGGHDGSRGQDGEGAQGGQGGQSDQGGASLHAVPPVAQTSAPSAASADLPSFGSSAPAATDAPDGSASARAAASWGTAGSITDAGPSAPAPSAPNPSAGAPEPVRSGAALVREAAQASRTAGQRNRGARGNMPEAPAEDVDPTGGATRDDADAVGVNRNGREVIEKLLGGKVLEVIDENRPR